MATTGNDRTIVKMAIATRSKESVEAVAERYGMTQIAITSRIYDWFAEQTETTQATILGLIPREHQQEIGQLVLAKLVAEPKASYILDEPEEQKPSGKKKR